MLTPGFILLCTLVLPAMSGTGVGTPGYVGTAVFSQHPGELGGHVTTNHLAKLTVALKQLGTYVVSIFKRYAPIAEPLLVAGVIGGGLLLILNSLKAALGYVTKGKPCVSEHSFQHSRSSDEAWKDETEDQCLQQAVCRLGRHVWQYHSPENILRVARTLPSSDLARTFLRSYDEECSQYSCQ